MRFCVKNFSNLLWHKRKWALISYIDRVRHLIFSVLFFQCISWKMNKYKILISLISKLLFMTYLWNQIIFCIYCPHLLENSFENLLILLLRCLWIVDNLILSPPLLGCFYLGVSTVGREEVILFKWLHLKQQPTPGFPVLFATLSFTI